MELLNLCRSCMKEVASWELENFDTSGVSMFTFCTAVQISDDDKLPKQFCYDCTIKIESSYTFIKKAQEVNVTLKNLISRAETSVIVKSENLTNNLQYTNLLQSDLDFRLEVNITKNEKDMFTSCTSQSFENKIEHDIYQSGPKNSSNEIFDPLTKKKSDKLESTLNSNTKDFDIDSEGISNDSEFDSQNVKKIKASNINITKNEANKILEQYEPNIAVSKLNSTFSKKSYNTRNQIYKTYGIKAKEKDKERKIEDNKTLVKCDICKTTYRYNSSLQKHIINKHSKDQLKERDKSKVQEGKEDNTDHEKTCNICDRKFSSALWFSRHIKNEHSVKQYFCPLCSKSFYAYHAWYHHKDSHAESRRFACEACGARFKRGKQLAAHARTHTEARPHVCTQCGMAFKIKSILTSHMKVHMNERPFLCSTCGYSAKTLATLNDHILTHTKEKPHECKECPFRATTRGNLRRHELRHRGERPCACQHCGKRFYEPGSLARHVRIHTGERPFQCLVCSQAFADGWKCKTHLMRAHRIPLENIPRLSQTKKANESLSQQV